MKRQSWYPSRIASQIQWHEQFRTALPTYVATLGLQQAKVDAAVASSRFVVYVLSQWLPAVRAFGPSSTETLDLLLDGSGSDPVVLPVFTAPALPANVAPVPPGALKRVFDLIAEIKEADAYTEAIGLALGIVGSADATQHASPKIKLELVQGPNGQVVRITFIKHGHMGVIIESTRNGSAWEMIGIDTESPYLDSRPLLQAGVPEVREYRARFWDKGTPNGEWTDVAKVTVAP